MSDKNTEENVMRTAANVPLLPPNIIHKENLVTELTAAHSAVGELRGFMGALQNPDLLIAPFRKREAVASSAIEGTRATLDEVMEYEAREDSAQEALADEEDRKILDIIEVRNYERAMFVAMEGLKKRPIGENLLKTTHGILLDSVRGADKDRGNFRKGQVAVGDYVPPVHTEIPDLMSNWEKYLHSTDEKDVLIRIGVAHYQFEAIHPFLDGNGRIGRLIIPLFLCQENVLQTPVLYVSHFFEKHKVEYQKLLHNVDLKQEWTPWLKFFLTAVQAQAQVTTAMAKEIQNLYEKLKGKVVVEIRSRHAIAVLDLIFTKPIISATHVREVIHAQSAATAYNLLRRFVEVGILREVFKVGREKYYVFTDLRKIIRSR